MRLPKYRCHTRGKDRTGKKGFAVWRRKRYYFPGAYNSRESLKAYRGFISDLLKRESSAIKSVDSTAAAALFAPVPGKPITVVDLAYRYLKYADLEYRDDTGQHTAGWSHVRRIMGILLDVCPDLPLTEFGPLALRDVRAHMLTCRKLVRKKDPVTGVIQNEEVGPFWTRGHINAQINRIRGVFSWAVAEEMIPAAVADALAHLPGLRKNKCAAPEGRKISPVDDEAVDRVLAVLSPTLRAMVLLERMTGMRPTVLCSMKGRLIDRTADVWLYRPEKYKSQRHDEQRRIESAPIFLGPQAQEILEPFLVDRDPDDYLFKPVESVRWYQEKWWPNMDKDRAERRLKTSQHFRDRFTADVFAKSIARAAKKAGVEHWFPYQLRHSHATAVRKKYKLEGAQVALGHKRADVTQVYAERDFDLARKIALEMG